MSNEKDAAAAAAADAAKKQEAEAAAKAEAKRLAEEDKILVVMVRDGDAVKVHPSCVKDHERVGFRVKQ